MHYGVYNICEGKINDNMSLNTQEGNGSTLVRVLIIYMK